RAWFRIINDSPEWRNWQTRWTQNPVSARTCGFDSLLRQSPEKDSHPRVLFCCPHRFIVAIAPRCRRECRGFAGHDSLSLDAPRVTFDNPREYPDMRRD